MQSSYRNLGYILLLFPLIIVAGFWIPYLSQIPKFDSSSPRQGILCADASRRRFLNRDAPQGISGQFGRWGEPDRRRHFAPRPYSIALWAYLMVETGWLALGRPV